MNDRLFPWSAYSCFVLFCFIATSKQMCNVQKSVPISEEMYIPEFQVVYLITIEKLSLFDQCLSIIVIWTIRTLTYINLGSKKKKRNMETYFINKKSEEIYNWSPFFQKCPHKPMWVFRCGPFREKGKKEKKNHIKPILEITKA